MNEMYNRFISKTPKFFKRIQILLGSIGTASTTVVVTPYHYPEWLLIAAKYGMVCGFFGVFLAQFTRDNKETDGENK